MNFYTVPEGHRNIQERIDQLVNETTADLGEHERARIRRGIEEAFGLGVEASAQIIDYARPYDSIPSTAVQIRKLREVPRAPTTHIEPTLPLDADGLSVIEGRSLSADLVRLINSVLNR